MEDKICSLAKNWAADTVSDTRSLNIFDTNGNTILRCGELCVPEKDASIIKSLLTNPCKNTFTVEIFKNHYICTMNSAGYLIGRGGFNVCEHNGSNEDKIKKTRKEKIERDIRKSGEQIDGTRYRHQANSESKEQDSKMENTNDLSKQERNEDQYKEEILEDNTQTQRADDHDGNSMEYKSIGSKYTDDDILVDTIAAGLVSGLVVVVRGMSRDRRSILGLLRDAIHSLTETKLHRLN